ncbi:MAG: carotenoid biosynthesis protein [Gemmatimonadaceae bacterium]|jgi:putative membrane protein|nr:carotenoid biosynthesis protein [Gemmatimonadaceae bacterium]
MRSPLLAPAHGSTTTLWRIALWCLVAHAALSVFSAVAFATFLIPPYPDWLMTPVNQKIMTFGYRFGGQTTVVLGAVAGLAYLLDCIDARRAIQVFVVSFVLSLAAELAGTMTGLPFGVYAYTDLLGYKILGHVPFNIPTSWFYMLVAALAMCGRILPAKDDGVSRWWWAFIAGTMLTVWDVSMDPAMVKTSHWLWHIPDLSQKSAFERFIGEPIFYGMPITNWLGWELTGVLVARAMLAIVPPGDWARHTSPSNLPLALYAANGVLPIVICFTWGMIPAGIIGTIVMGIPLIAAWRAGPRATLAPRAVSLPTELRGVRVASK